MDVRCCRDLHLVLTPFDRVIHTRRRERKRERKRRVTELPGEELIRQPQPRAESRGDRDCVCTVMQNPRPPTDNNNTGGGGDGNSASSTAAAASGKTLPSLLSLSHSLSFSLSICRHQTVYLWGACLGARQHATVHFQLAVHTHCSNCLAVAVLLAVDGGGGGGGGGH